MDKSVILAKKYGRAIYEIAAEQGSLEKTEEELRLIADAIIGSEELSHLLNHPMLARDVKKDTIQKLFDDKVSPTVLQFCYVVIDKDRIADFPAMVDNFVILAHQGLGIEEAVVTSALPLSKKQAELLKEKLSRITGRAILLKQKVDTSLLGGFTVQVGDRLIDGSVARQLETLRSNIMRRD